LSLTVSVALSAPLMLGLKATLIVHEALAASVAGKTGQLFVWGKSALFVPVNAMLVIVSGPVLVLLSVTGCAVLVVPTAWLPKLKLAGEAVAVGETPVPVKETVCGLPAALSVMVRKPGRVPPVEGVKVTLIVQFAPAAIVAGATGQLLVCAKSPVMAIELMTRGAVPELVTVTACAALVVPTF